MSRVDVIIPCYNYGRYLTQCVESILSQEDVEVRGLIIDDASTDNSAAIAGGLAEADSRLAVRRHESNQGHIATYNEGLAWAESDYVLLISADDLLVPGALRLSSQVLDSESAVVLTYGRQIVFSDEHDLRTPSINPLTPQVQILNGDSFIEGCCKSASNPAPTPTVVARRSAIVSVGGYRADLPHTADLELWLRLASVGDVGVIDEYQACKRTHSANMQHAYVRAEVGDLLQRQSAFERFFEFDGTDAKRSEQRKRWADEALAMDAFWRSVSAFDRGDLERHLQLLDIARTLNPALTARPEWLRLQLKKILGTKLCGYLRPLSDRLRRFT